MWMMIKPLFHSFLFGAILAGCFYPLFFHVRDLPKISRNSAAIIITLLIVVLVFIPSIFIIIALSKESIALYSNSRDFFMSESFTGLFSADSSAYIAVTSFLEEIGVDADISRLKNELLNYAQLFSGYILKTVNSWISNIISFLFSFIIMILVIYALFSQGDKLKAFLLKLSPLPDDQEELLLKNFNQMNYVTIVCNGLGGIIQGVLAGIGFWLAGIPSIVLWTVVMTFLAFIPLLGISIIYIPAVIYLFLTGKTVAAVVIFIYCSAVALIVENWFKPWFIGQRIKMNSLFVLFCIIGGMSYFGIPGIFYGPIIGIVFLTLVDLYHAHYLNA
jgi:predicted PurR-regulated permease PerM